MPRSSENSIIVVWIVFVFCIHGDRHVGVFSLGIPERDAPIDAEIVVAQRCDVDITVGRDPESRMPVGISQL